MKRTIHLITSFLVTFTFITHTVIAQKEANTWYFGNFTGIDFNSGAPVAIANSAMSAYEGCASISDKNTGEILLYTNGATVWNANHQVMDNGTGLTADASSAQAAVIVPDPETVINTIFLQRVSISAMVVTGTVTASLISA